MKRITARILILFLVTACGSGQEQDHIIFAPEPVVPNAKLERMALPEKFIIKASNNMYLSISSDSTLIANQPDPAKAEVFKKVDLENGKVAIKTSGGKFISDNRNSSSKLDAIRDQALGWETFEVIAADPQGVNVKSSGGKYICADQGKGNVLYANRDKAGAWETFILESK
jgi:hypothetical protein